MKIYRVLLTFPFLLAVLRADAAVSPGPSDSADPARTQDTAETLAQNAVHTQHPHMKIPTLEELTVVRQKESFVARKYRNYDTTTVTPTLKNTEL